MKFMHPSITEILTNSPGNIGARYHLLLDFCPWVFLGSLGSSCKDSTWFSGQIGGNNFLRGLVLGSMTNELRKLNCPNKVVLYIVGKDIRC